MGLRKQLDRKYGDNGWTTDLVIPSSKRGVDSENVETVDDPDSLEDEVNGERVKEGVKEIGDEAMEVVEK